MTLLWADGEEFTTGACEYANRPATTGELLNRLFIPFAVQGIQTNAVVDTGGAYLIPGPEIVSALGLDAGNALETRTIVIRGTTYRGALHRVLLAFSAAAGEGVVIEATAFIPELAFGETWPLPTYLGWQGCLERLRFALDPVAERFFFGPA